jgi:hypothetical protein
MSWELRQFLIVGFRPFFEAVTEGFVKKSKYISDATDHRANPRSNSGHYYADLDTAWQMRGQHIAAGKAGTKAGNPPNANAKSCSPHHSLYSRKSLALSVNVHEFVQIQQGMAKVGECVLRASLLRLRIQELGRRRAFFAGRLTRERQ